MPGPDAGQGGKHLLLSPIWEGEVPKGYYAARSTTYRVIFGIRAVPVEGDLQAAMALIPTVEVHPWILWLLRSG